MLAAGYSDEPEPQDYMTTCEDYNKASENLRKVGCPA